MNNLQSSEDFARATRTRLDGLYEYLVDEEDARVCTDIDERACREVPRNFFLMLVANVFTKLGDELSNPKTVLAWLFNFAGAPLGLVGFLVPIRESGSLIPQLLFAAPVRALARRKWAWVAGSLGQALAVMGIGGVALALQGWAAGIAILVLLTVFSLCRGLCSIAHKDVVGKTIPKTRRGRLGGWSGTVAGLLGLAVGVYLALGLAPDTAGFYGGLLLAAGGLWLLGAGCFALVSEQPGDTGGGGNAIAEALKSLRLLRDDAAFRRFVSVRSLLLCSALTAPYYVLLAQQEGSGLWTLGLFMIASGLAGSLSSPVWGRLADRSSKQVMIRAALLTAGNGVVVFLVTWLLPVLAALPGFYPLAFFVLGIAHSGVRLGRKTYLLDLAGGNKRTDYVAVSNTVIGVVLLAAGSIGALAAVVPPEGIVLVLSLLGLGGAALGGYLPEVE